MKFTNDKEVKSFEETLSQISGIAAWVPGIFNGAFRNAVNLAVTHGMMAVSKEPGRCVVLDDAFVENLGRMLAQAGNLNLEQLPRMLEEAAAKQHK